MKRTREQRLRWPGDPEFAALAPTELLFTSVFRTTGAEQLQCSSAKLIGCFSDGDLRVEGEVWLGQKFGECHGECMGCVALDLGVMDVKFDLIGEFGLISVRF